MKSGQNWYLEYKRNPSAFLRLFCFHHSGGGASGYYPWINHLSPHIEMIAIQLPGRENRFSEPLNNNLIDIVAELSKRFVDYRDKPFLLFGHSLGALISFEFAKSIQQLYSTPPSHMIISASKAPHMPFRRKHLSQLDNQTLKDYLKIYDGLDESILNNEELLELFLPILKSDFSICEGYRFSESKPFPCDILALSGDQDETVTLEEILAWEKYTEDKFEHMSLSGKHFFVKGHRNKILEIINQIADRYVQHI